MDSQLGEFEQKHQIIQRWKPADKKFVDAKHILLQREAALVTCFHEGSYSKATVPVKAESKICRYTIIIPLSMELWYSRMLFY